MFVHPLAEFAEEELLARERWARLVEDGRAPRGTGARLESETVAETDLGSLKKGALPYFGHRLLARCVQPKRVFPSGAGLGGRGGGGGAGSAAG